MKTKYKNYLFIILGSFIVAFTVYNFHAYVHIGEIGFLGISLFLYQEFTLTPALTSLFFCVVFCLWGSKLMSRQEIIYSLVAGFSFFTSYAILNFFPRILPEINNYPLIAAILGGVLYGAGISFCTRFGIGIFGDENFAYALRQYLHIPLRLTKVTIDVFSLIIAFSYIPLDSYYLTLISTFISACTISVFLSVKSV